MKYFFLFLLIICFERICGQQLQWAYGFGSSTNGDGYCVKHDNLGNTVFTGTFDGTQDFDPGPATNTLTPIGLQDLFIAKYDATGNLLWAFNLGAGGATTIGFKTTTDASANVVVTGLFTASTDFNPGAGVDSLSGSGFFIAKYDPNGIFIWAIPVPAVANSIIIDNNQNILATGTFSGNGDFNPGPGTNLLTANGVQDAFLAKFDSNGNHLWAFNVGNSGNSSAGMDLVCSSSNEIILTGNFQGSNDFDPGSGVNLLTSQGLYDIYIAKYDMNGGFLWASNIGGAKSDKASGIVQDPNGNIFLTGIFYGTADFDPGPGVDTISTVFGSNFIAKYNSSCAYQWAFAIDNIGISSLAADVAGNIFITGAMNGTTDFDPSPAVNSITSYNQDIFLASYTNSGMYQWAFNVGCSNFYFSSNSVAVSSQGIWICGKAPCINGDFDPGPGVSNLSSTPNGIFLAKYLSFVGVKELTANSAIRLFPVPTQKLINIELAQDNKFCSVSITDLLGNGLLQTDKLKSIDVSHLTNGVYFIIMQSQEVTFKQKFIICK